MSHFRKVQTKVQTSEIKRAEILFKFQPITLVVGGEREIRTLDRSFPLYSLSRRVPSAARPFLRVLQIGGGGRIRTHVALTLNGFQDRRLQPLGHSSEIDPKLISSCRKQVKNKLSAGPYSASRIQIQRIWMIKIENFNLV